MRLSCLGPLLVALFITPMATLPAQAPAQPDSEQMTIHVTVSGHNGAPVWGLTKDDFTLFDNKNEQPITGLKVVKEPQTGIVIVLDAVNLPYNQVSFARQQLAQFFSTNSGRLSQPTTLAILQDKGLQIQPNFTTDGNALRSSLDSSPIGLRQLRRASGIYGAQERFQISRKAFQGLIGQLPKEGAKRIIWISPGWPLLSGPEVTLSPSQRANIFSNVVAITTRLHRSNIIVDAINPTGATQDVGQTNYTRPSCAHLEARTTSCSANSACRSSPGKAAVWC